MNQHYAFWVDYYAELNTQGYISKDNTAKRNHGFETRTWAPGEVVIPLQEQSFCLKSTYPGVAMGLGNSHEAGDEKEKETSEIQLGCSFDYVTGLPVIPGSSVKGVLRSVFLWLPEYVLALLAEQGISLSLPQLKKLELSIFGNRNAYDAFRKQQDADMGNDVFFDAFPVQADKNGHLMGMDYITPHLSKDPDYQGLTEPNPNAFLKVMPGVVFQFRFRLKNSTVDNVTVKACQKQKLFHQLLLDLGAGAKTNVGYGGFEAYTEGVKNESYLVLTDAETARASAVQAERAARLPAKAPETIPNVEVPLDTVFTATVKDVKTVSKGNNKGKINKISLTLEGGQSGWLTVKPPIVAPEEMVKQKQYRFIVNRKETDENGTLVCALEFVKGQEQP